VIPRLRQRNRASTEKFASAVEEDEDEITDLGVGRFERESELDVRRLLEDGQTMGPEQKAQPLHRLEELSAVRREGRTGLDLGDRDFVIAAYGRTVLARSLVEREPVGRAVALVSIAPEPGIHLMSRRSRDVYLLDDPRTISGERPLFRAAFPVHLAVGVTEPSVVVGERQHEIRRLQFAEWNAGFADVVGAVVVSAMQTRQ
jgi:hypothetical protein